MTEIESGVHRELPDERQVRAMQALEDDLRTYVDSHVLGRPSAPEQLRSTEKIYEDLARNQGFEDVRAVASRVWGCPMPLEPEPPAFYPGLEVQIRRNQGIFVVSDNAVYPGMAAERGRVDAVNGDRVLVMVHGRAKVEVFRTEQLVPLGPPLERRFCSHRVGDTFLTRLKLRVFRNAGRCPLHGLRLQDSIDVQLEGRLPHQGLVYATVVVE